MFPPLRNTYVTVMCDTYMDWKCLRNLLVTENQSLISEYTDLTSLRIVVKQVELFVLLFLRVEKDLQSVWYRITKSRVQFILIASVFFVEVFMDADMPNLAKGLACSTRRIVVYQGFEKAPVS